MDKIALITGVNGQDGSYLAEFLFDKGYVVHGTKRRSSTVTTQRLSKLLEEKSGTDLDYKVHLHHADVTDSSSINRLIDEIRPNEVYNLAAQSHVAVSFEEPEYTADTDALGCLRVLEAIRRSGRVTKFYQASTSELFGGQDKGSYNEESPINPRSPYAAAKAYAYYLVKQYRDAYGLFAVNGILFNHESPRRGENFISKKIIVGVEKIISGEIEYLSLGNLNASRDWGHAKDYVRSMWMMLQHPTADDWVVATGKSYTVREFCVRAFAYRGIGIEFNGEGVNEVGIVTSNASESGPGLGKSVIRIDERFFRPLEVDSLKGDATRARNLLGWQPTIDLNDLIKDMFDAAG